MLRHGPQKGVHQWHVDHRHLVDDEQITPELVLLVAPEAAPPGIDVEQPVDGFGGAASALAEPLGRPSSGRRKRDLDALGAEHFEDRVDQGGLAYPRATGDDQDLREESEPKGRPWLSASVMPALASTHGTAFAGSM